MKVHFGRLWMVLAMLATMLVFSPTSETWAQSKVRATIDDISLGMSRAECDEAQRKKARSPHTIGSKCIYFEGPSLIESSNVGPTLQFSENVVEQVEGYPLGFQGRKYSFQDSLMELTDKLGSPDKRYPVDKQVSCLVYYNLGLTVSIDTVHQCIIAFVMGKPEIKRGDRQVWS